MTAHRCPKCASPMAGTEYADAGSLLTTIWLCPQCLHRERTSRPNLRAPVLETERKRASKAWPPRPWWREPRATAAERITWHALDSSRVRPLR